MSAAKPSPVVVYGSGGHGRETALLVRAMIDAGAPWRLLGFLDDDVRQHGAQIGSLTVLGGAEYLANRRGQIDVALGIGQSRARFALVERIRSITRSFPVLVHPDIPRFERVLLDEGAQIHAGAILTVDIHVGPFVILNRHVDVSHDCQLDAFATLAPAVTLAGNVHVGVGSELGVRAACIPGVHVGAWSVVGAGAVVTRSIPDGVTAVGVPARAVSTVR
jgi:sugar O-acyltransferase (sialic acid O-acetyltransferase NeuD family)